MTGHVDTERILDAFLAPEHDQLADRVLEAAFIDIARIPQRRALRVPWRFPSMSRLSSTTRFLMVGAVLLLAVAGAVYVGGGVGPVAPTSAPPTQTPTPAPTPLATVAPSVGAVLPPVADWIPYTSAVYGIETAYPPGWRIMQAATRPWDPALDEPAPDGTVSPAIDIFSNETGTVVVSTWKVADAINSPTDDRAALIAWVEAFCASMEYEPCEGIPARAIPMCVERADCHPSAVVVPFSGDVLGFIDTADSVTIVQVWRVDSDPEVAPYGGAVPLLQAFLETLNVFVPQPGQV